MRLPFAVDLREPGGAAGGVVPPEVFGFPSTGFVACRAEPCLRPCAPAPFRDRPGLVDWFAVDAMPLPAFARLFERPFFDEAFFPMRFPVPPVPGARPGDRFGGFCSRRRIRRRTTSML